MVDQVDVRRLEAWMTANVPRFAGPVELIRLSGGQSNPTWRLRTPARDYVLRQKPLGPVLPSAHAVDREFKVMSALKGSGVPVPEVIALCEDPEVFGSMFFVMEYLEGRSILDPRLQGMQAPERAAIFEAMNGATAAMSTVDPLAIGLADYGRHGGYVERQVARWSKQYHASQTQPIPEMDALIEWLPKNLPDTPEEIRIAHGDFRLDNLILHPTEAKVLAIVDWELSTLGCPIADFAYNAMIWRLPPDLFRGLGGVDLKGSGIPTEEEYVARWFERTGRKRPDNFNFYVVLSMFRISAILQGIAKRAEDGTASDPKAADMGARAAPLARVAWAAAQGR